MGRCEAEAPANWVERNAARNVDRDRAVGHGPGGSDRLTDQFHEAVDDSSGPRPEDWDRRLAPGVGIRRNALEGEQRQADEVWLKVADFIDDGRSEKRRVGKE